MVPWMLVAAAWDENLENLEEYFNAMRVEAITNPDIKTFVSLVKLRRTITEARKGLQDTRAGVKSQDEACLSLMLAEHDPNSLDAIFTRLLN
jgi:hypothetical protein